MLYAARLHDAEMQRAREGNIPIMLDGMLIPVALDDGRRRQGVSIGFELCYLIINSGGGRCAGSRLYNSRRKVSTFY